MSNYQIQRLNNALLATSSNSLLPKLPSNDILMMRNKGANPFLHILPKHQNFPRKYGKSWILCSSKNVKPGESRVSTSSIVADKAVKIKATVTVQATMGGFFSNLGITWPLDEVTDLLGKTFLLEFVSTELDSSKHYIWHLIDFAVTFVTTISSTFMHFTYRKRF